MPAKFDFHVHTRYSDGKGTTADMVEAAEARELEAFALTDHGPDHSAGISPGKLPHMLSDIELARAGAGIQVLAGIEANITGASGNIDFEEEFMRKLDLVLVGVHKLTGVSENPVDRARAYLEMVTNAIKRQKVDVLAHPFHFLDYLVPYLSHEDIWGFVGLAAERGVAMEVNSRYRTPDEDFLKLCLREGVKLSIGSDAHTAAKVGRIDWELAMLRRSGARREDTILDRFLK